MAFSPDGATIAAGRLDSTIQLWSVGDGRLLTTFGAEHARVYDITFSPDGQFLASGGGPPEGEDMFFVWPWDRDDDTRIRIWRVADQRPVLVLKSNKKGVTSVAFSPDGSLLASADRGGAIRLWRVR
jgi:WD40 repeat protein